jgi:hypothetical protein
MKTFITFFATAVMCALTSQASADDSFTIVQNGKTYVCTATAEQPQIRVSCTCSFTSGIPINGTISVVVEGTDTSTGAVVWTRPTSTSFTWCAAEEQHAGFCSAPFFTQEDATAACNSAAAKLPDCR